MIGKCLHCKKRRVLTKHSKIGFHLPPYIMLCRPCHNLVHGIKQRPGRINMRSQKGNLKNIKGTRRK